MSSYNICFQGYMFRCIYTIMFLVPYRKQSRMPFGIIYRISAGYIYSCISGPDINLI